MITNSSLKQNSHHGSGVEAGLSWVLCSGFHETTIKVLGGLHSHLEAWRGKNLIPSLFQMLAEFTSLQLCDWEPWPRLGATLKFLEGGVFFKTNHGKKHIEWGPRPQGKSDLIPPLDGPLCLPGGAPTPLRWFQDPHPHGAPCHQQAHHLSLSASSSTHQAAWQPLLHLEETLCTPLLERWWSPYALHFPSQTFIHLVSSIQLSALLWSLYQPRG